MEDTKQQVIDLALATRLSKYEELKAISPELPAVLAATITQTINEDMAGILEEYSNKASKVRGRSGVTTSGSNVDTSALSAEDKSWLRPNGESYFTRKWGEHDDILVLRKAREAQHFVLLYGAPGCGKTALVEAAFGEELHTVLGSGDTEVADLVGGYSQSPDGGFIWTDGPLIKAAESGSPLLIDEIGLIDPKVLSIVYGLMDGRKEYTVTANPERGTVKAKDGFYVIAATNPNAPGVRLSEALLSRFIVQVEMTTDWGLAKKLGCPTPIVTAAQNLAKKQTSGEVSWAPQFRELLAFRDLEKIYGTDWAVQNLLAAAPEMDRPVVADVFARTYGKPVLPARI
jgi:predicted ATPase with chaperone activity